MEKVTVKINEEGTTATEVNSRIQPPSYHTLDKLSNPEYVSTIWEDCRLWQEAESKLRTFEIEGQVRVLDEIIEISEVGRIYLTKVNSIHQGEVTKEGRVRIL